MDSMDLRDTVNLKGQRGLRKLKGQREFDVGTITANMSTKKL